MGQGQSRAYLGMERANARIYKIFVYPQKAAKFPRFSVKIMAWFYSQVPCTVLFLIKNHLKFTVWHCLPLQKFCQFLLLKNVEFSVCSKQVE